MKKSNAGCPVEPTWVPTGDGDEGAYVAQDGTGQMQLQGMFPFPGTMEEWAQKLAEDGCPDPELEYDPVSHPKHYTSGKYEVIDIIEDQLGMDGLRNFCLGNAIKYICRSGKKYEAKTLEDLEKASWYLNHYIERMKAENGREGN